MSSVSTRTLSFTHSRTHFHLTSSTSQPLCYLFRGFALRGHLRPSQFQQQISFDQHTALGHLQFLLYACMEKTSPPPVNPLMPHKRGLDRSKKRARTICWSVIFMIFLNTNPENIWCLLQSTGTGVALSGVMTNSETSMKCSHSNSKVFLSAADAVWQV